MAGKKSGKQSGRFVVKFHEPVEQPGKRGYVAIDVWEGGKFFGTLEVDDEGVEWWCERNGNRARVAEHEWDQFHKRM